MEVEVEVTQPVQQRDELNSSVGARRWPCSSAESSCNNSLSRLDSPKSRAEGEMPMGSQGRK